MSRTKSFVPLPTTQHSPARLQTKYTFINNNTTTPTTHVSRSPFDENMVPAFTRARTTSTSSVDTIRISSPKKIKEGTKIKAPTGSKKRCRASDSTSSGIDPAMSDIRRIRQRTLSSSSTATVRADDCKSDIAFPSTEESPMAAETSKSSIPTRRNGSNPNRKVSPPKLNPGHSAPAVAVAVTESVIPTTAAPHRDAPPPPVVPSQGRQRVSSLATKQACSNSHSRQMTPPVRSFVPSRYRSTLFEPLPMHLHDWEASTSSRTSVHLNDADEQTSCDEDAQETPATGGSWKDQWGNVHLGFDDLDLSITFHKKQPFFDVWDLPDDIYIGVPARIHLTVKDAHRWTGYSLAPEPDVRYIDIRCNSFEYRTYPATVSSTARNPDAPFILPPEYAVAYTGTSSSEYSQNATVPIDLSRGVVVNKKWHKTFPGNKVSPHREQLISTYRMLPDDSIESAVGDGDGDEDHVVMRRGWYFKFVVPIPMWVVRMGNSRAFTLETSVWVGPTGGEDSAHYYGEDTIPEGGLLRQETEMVISHLRSEEEMAKKLPASD
ncbi:hypothetical protein VKT23_018236 [Stygiomarasmius scandens]|uniref:Uncharacterized protein n=1 Tax=Marasmiellus scandens TaxID=2682957 RepID=A0ABR1IU29_9AGAR